MSERKLATIRTIVEIMSIENADAIEAYRVNDWWVVGQKDSYNVGELVIFAEIDSWIPTELAPFLTKGKEPREYNGVKGERLKTIKLRGQISQGLLLPLSVLPEEENLYEDGEDVTELLGIQKWERPMDTHLAGICKGNFPSWIRKTDQERIQNLSRQFENLSTHNMYEVTEKLDGTSITVYYHREHGFGVCSRNLDLKRDETNSFWKKAIEMDLETKLSQFVEKYGVGGIAIQGELCGEGIQKNIYGLKGHKFFGFNVWLDTFTLSTRSDTKTFYIVPGEHHVLFAELEIESVPVIERHYSIDGMTIREVLEMAEGKSQLAGVEREGLVFKMEFDGNISFKAISNKFLMKHGD